MTKDTINLWDLYEKGGKARDKRISEVLGPRIGEIMDRAWEHLKSKTTEDNPLPDFPKALIHMGLHDSAKQATGEFMTSVHLLQKHGAMGDLSIPVFIRCVSELTADLALHGADQKKSKGNIQGIAINAAELPPEVIELIKKMMGR